MSEFLDYVTELLEPLGAVEARRMFGAHGLFRNGRMFGIVADDMLYLRVDDRNRPVYEARGLPPFRYQRRGRSIALAYYRVPDSALDGAAELLSFAKAAYGAALRAPATPGPRRGGGAGTRSSGRAGAPDR